MRAVSILLLCILGHLLLTSVNCSNANSPTECCFTWYSRKINRNLITSYQVTGDRCSQYGVILVTVKGLRICVYPNLPWVKGIKKYLDEKSM